MTNQGEPSLPARRRLLVREAAVLTIAGAIGALGLAGNIAASSGSPGWRWVVDAAVGVASLVLLRSRRSRPATVAVLVVIASTWCSSVLGSTAVAILALATTRRWRPIAGVGALLVATTVLDDLSAGEPGRAGEQAVLVAALYAALAGVGAYLGSRRDLIAALRERAAATEREQHARVEQAQVAERTRIAREMHDVLAHRISLVAMHAGALAFRTDLPAQEQAATAAVVRDNANLALAELRQVLGVLRSDSAPVPEPPQPSLDAVDALVAEAGALGDQVLLDVADATRAALPRVPADLGRHAYRIVQEALTNARKHAAGSPVRVAIAGAPGGLLTVEVVNGAATRPPTGVVGSGTGLVGVAERARLTGGRLDHGPDAAGGYRVRAVLPGSWRRC